MTVCMIGCGEGPVERKAEAVRDKTHEKRDSAREKVKEHTEHKPARSDSEEENAKPAEHEGRKKPDLIERRGERKANRRETER
jgi:hypothetical protein